VPYKDPIKRAQYLAKYHKKNKSKIKARNKEKYIANKEEIKERSRKYYLAHQIERKSYSQQYKKNNTEKIKIYAAEYNKAYYENNKEHLSFLHKKYRRIHKNRYKLSIKKSAHRGLEFGLTEQQYISLINNLCYYCDNNFGSTFENMTGVGLDRLNNSKGYFLENVVPCCTKCNVIRNDILTPEETKIAIQAVINFRKGK